MKPRRWLSLRIGLEMPRHRRKVDAMTMRVQSPAWLFGKLLPLLLVLVLPSAAQAQYGYTNGFFYMTNGGVITIEGYGGPGGDVTIPDTINGLPVTGIEDRLFWKSTSLTSVTIGSNVTSIAYEAFYNCINLTSVTIGHGVTNIGADAFMYCTSLTNVTIGYSVISIGVNAFDECRLTSVTIPDSVTSIGGSAFESCYRLTSVTIGSGVTNIGYAAFLFCYSLTNVTIPDSLTSISDYSFCWCTSLRSITIPNAVTNIGDYAFWNCPNLTEVYFKDDAPSIGSSTFSGDTNTTIYYLPGTTGWDKWVSPPLAVLWNPLMQDSGPSFGVHNNKFGFTITGTTNIPIAVEASTNLASASWTALQTCTLTNGSIYFSDPAWTNYPARFYRLRSP
jgi:hypothetical protein